jgi:hypothetical protein
LHSTNIPEAIEIIKVFIRFKNKADTSAEPREKRRKGLNKPPVRATRQTDTKISRLIIASSIWDSAPAQNEKP